LLGLNGDHAYQLWQDSTSCIMQYQSNWYWYWSKSNGTVGYTANGMGAFTIDASGNGNFAGWMNSGGWRYAGNPAFGCWFDGYKFQTNQPDGGANDFLVRSYDVGGTWYGINAAFVTAAQTGVYFYYANMSTATIVAASPSDRRLKRNIKPAGDALSIVRDLAVHDLDFQVPDGSIGPEHWNFSLIADEVEQVLPYAVLNPPFDPKLPTAYSGLHGNHLIATLWRAVQQLAAEVTQLKEARA
jgi:hypothetical protein